MDAYFKMRTSIDLHPARGCLVSEIGYTVIQYESKVPLMKAVEKGEMNLPCFYRNKWSTLDRACPAFTYTSNIYGCASWNLLAGTFHIKHHLKRHPI